MNQIEFIEKLFGLFPSKFTKENKQLWWDGYKKVLSEKIDYEKLYNTVLSGWDKTSAPPPAWLKDHSEIKIYYTQPKNDYPYSEKITVSVNGSIYSFWYDPKQMTAQQAKSNVEAHVKGGKDKEVIFIEGCP